MVSRLHPNGLCRSRRRWAESGEPTAKTTGDFRRNSQPGTSRATSPPRGDGHLVGGLNHQCATTNGRPSTIIPSSLMCHPADPLSHLDPPSTPLDALSTASSYSRTETLQGIGGWMSNMTNEEARSSSHTTADAILSSYPPRGSVAQTNMTGHGPSVHDTISSHIRDQAPFAPFCHPDTGRLCTGAHSHGPQRQTPEQTIRLTRHVKRDLDSENDGF